jgi:plastocyanin
LYKRVLLVLATSFVLALTACGGNGYGGGGGPAETSAPAAQPTSGADGQQVSLADFSYSPNTLTAQAGQPLDLNVRNQGTQRHSFTITGVTDSGVVQPGGQATVDFTPSQAGTLTYFCTVHGQAVMSGTLTVR